MLEQNKKHFNKLFDEFHEVKYKEEWANGTGYLNGFVRDDEAFSNSNKVKFYDGYGRRCIGIKKDNNIAVIFERYSDNDDVLVCNLSNEFIYNFKKEHKILCEGNLYGKFHNREESVFRIYMDFLNK